MCAWGDFGLAEPAAANYKTTIHMFRAWIHAPSRRSRRPPRWEDVPPGRPLRVVIPSELDPTRPDLAQCLADLAGRYALGGVERIDVPTFDGRGRPLHD
ncbi:MAG: hypothetical protein KGM43_04400 [Planctomycetota bacterium]|nr:hypothetical protein [Planctomycetota bacterium]